MMIGSLTSTFLDPLRSPRGARTADSGRRALNCDASLLRQQLSDTSGITAARRDIYAQSWTSRLASTRRTASR